MPRHIPLGLITDQRPLEHSMALLFFVHVITFDKAVNDVEVFFRHARPQTTSVIFEGFFISQECSTRVYLGLLKGFLRKLCFKSPQNLNWLYNLVYNNYDDDPLHNGDVYLLLKHCDTVNRESALEILNYKFIKH